MPATPADAIMAVPNCLTDWKTMSIDAMANNMMTATTIFLSTITCVLTPRATRLSAMSRRYLCNNSSAMALTNCTRMKPIVPMSRRLMAF